MNSIFEYIDSNYQWLLGAILLPISLFLIALALKRRRERFPKIRFPKDISEKAVEILISASLDKGGHVLRAISSDGLGIMSNFRNHVKGKNPRSEAQGGAALEELINRGYIAPFGSRGEAWKITRSGFDKADSYPNNHLARSLPTEKPAVQLIMDDLSSGQRDVLWAMTKGEPCMVTIELARELDWDLAKVEHIANELVDKEMLKSSEDAPDGQRGYSIDPMGRIMILQLGYKRR